MLIVEFVTGTKIKVDLEIGKLLNLRIESGDAKNWQTYTRKGEDTPFLFLNLSQVVGVYSAGNIM